MAFSQESNDNGKLKVLIVGAGIAGLASAIALRAPNREILILEQSSLNREIGATISLQPNASKIVEKEWGLGAKLKSRGSMIDKAFRICSTDGKEQTRIDLISKLSYGGNRVVYHRQDLHDVLKEAATSSNNTQGPGAEIRVSSRVISANCPEGSVTLENGEVLEGFDVVIGADGIRSMIRGSVLGKEVNAVPTGVSAYRMIISAGSIEDDEQISRFLNPRDSCTTMVVGHDCRLIMGPARNGEIYSIVAMVPDEKAHENTNATSWTTEGNMDSLLESFKEFPDWCKRLFKHAPELGLWQLRDLDPLETWHRGRVILIGDASHGMLPTQGQGASQSIEDAEALGAFFKDVTRKPTIAEVNSILREIEATRKPRATLIQGYSRQAAKPATEKKKITLNPEQFMDYNCLYNGAKDWQRRQASELAL